MSNVLITEERLRLLEEERAQKRKSFFCEIEKTMGEGVVHELSKLFGIYTEGLYIWLAGLWDSSTGGFYYSNSAKDTHGFLPDLESTIQALRIVRCTGLLSSRGVSPAVPEKMRIAVANFAKNLQSPDDGYFYHPQWGKRIGVPRRGRDNTWGLKLIEEMGEKPLYPTSLERLSSKEKVCTAPEHLRSLEDFKKYLSGFDLEHKSYSTGNILQAQCQQIIAAGQDYVDALFKWLDAGRKENGLWEEQINYASVNGLMKLTMIYTVCKRPMSNIERALESAIAAAMSDEEVTFCCEYYNPLITINMLRNSIEADNSTPNGSVFGACLKRDAEKLIRITREKVSLCLKEDGSFSYTPKFSAYRSQGAPVSLFETNEGDVNATQISTVGTVSQITSMLVGIDSTPLYFEGDSKLFFDLIENAEPIKKVYPKPEYIEEILSGYAKR